MNKLFIELYLDEDVDVVVAQLLAARGFSAVTARDENQLQKSDSEQLNFAIIQQRALLTHNRADFEELALEYFNNSQEHFGIIIATRHSPYEIVRRLLLILDQVSADEMQNQIRYI